MGHAQVSPHSGGSHEAEEPQELLQRAQTQPAPNHHTRNRAHPSVRSPQGKACCFPEAARLWTSPCHWSLPSERMPPPPHQPDLRHCYQDEGRYFWSSDPRTCQRRVLPSPEAEEAPSRRGRDLRHQEGGVRSL